MCFACSTDYEHLFVQAIIEGQIKLESVQKKHYLYSFLRYFILILVIYFLLEMYYKGCI